MLRMLWLLAIAAVLAASPCAAQQQRSATIGNASLNRAWPWTGRWKVLLLKHIDSIDLQCNVYTGYRDPDTHEDYLWGWRDYKGELAFFVRDQNSEPVSGQNVTLYIDDVKVLVMPITERGTRDLFNGILAPVPEDKKAAIVELLKSGGAIRLVTEQSNYAEYLWGMKKTMEYYDECRGQAERLNALQKSPG
jgi:hypothetical protein